MINLRHDKKGITLVEAMVAMALVALIVSTVVITVAQSSVNSNRLDMIYAASTLARQRMDHLKVMNFRDLEDRASETNVRIDHGGNEDVAGGYIRTTEVDEDWGSNPYMTKVKVSVDRVVDGSASGHPVVVETIFADVE